MKTKAIKSSAQNQSRLQNETRISRTGTNWSKTYLNVTELVAIRVICVKETER
jgi:hypothetical protein